VINGYFDISGLWLCMQAAQESNIYTAQMGTDLGCAGVHIVPAGRCNSHLPGPLSQE
jgi:hypothetical protein